MVLLEYGMLAAIGVGIYMVCGIGIMGLAVVQVTGFYKIRELNVTTNSKVV
jgi:hypothetical protein